MRCSKHTTSQNTSIRDEAILVRETDPRHDCPSSVEKELK
jgi:hypothetical protein